MWETWVQFLGWEDALEEELATHCSILTWRIPRDRGAWWTMGSQVRHDWVTKWPGVKYLTKNWIMCLLMVDKIINITLPLPVLNLSIFLTFANLMRKCYYFKISIFITIRGAGYISCSYWYLLFLNWLECSLPNVGSIHWGHSPIENKYVIDSNPFS